MQGCLKALHFTVCRHENGMTVRIDERFLYEIGFKILFLVQMPKKGAKPDAKKAPASNPMCQVKREFPRIEPVSRPDFKPCHLVLVVSDKEKRRSAAKSSPVDFNAKIEKGETAKCIEEGPGEGRPLAGASAFLFSDASLHDVRIDSKTGIVDKDASINFAHIDPGGVPVDQGLNSSFEICWNSQILRKMIQRPERQNAERFSGANHFRSHGGDGAITSPSNYQVILAGDGLLAYCSQFVAPDQTYFRAKACRPKEMTNLGFHLVRLRVGTGARIQENDHY